MNDQPHQPDPNNDPNAASTGPADESAQSQQSAGADPGAQTPPPGEQVVIDIPTKDSTNMAMLAHLLGIFTGFIGALIIWLVKKDTDPFVEDQGKEALNFQITVIIAQLIAVVLTFATCGILFPLPMAVGIATIVFCILAAIKSNEGVRYRYPVCIRFIK